MPYISQQRRKVLDQLVVNESEPGHILPQILSTGELNYLLTRVIELYRKQNGTNYKTMNDIAGAFDNAKHEFKRRIQDPYEDAKIKINGDVYDLDDIYTAMREAYE